MPSITAILPAYNERPRGSVVLRARQHVDRVIVVDEGSSDRMAEVAALAGAEVILHSQNMGKGAALRTLAFSPSMAMRRSSQTMWTGSKMHHFGLNPTVYDSDHRVHRDL